jgi:hypothetical protein
VFVENSDSGHLEAVPLAEAAGAAAGGGLASGPKRHVGGSNAFDADADNDGDAAGEDEVSFGDNLTCSPVIYQLF